MTSDQPITDFQWRAHPACEHPPKAAIGGVLILAIATAVYFNFGWAWAVISGAALLASLYRFYFPSRFTIDGRGITARNLFRPKEFLWSDVRRFVCDANGGYLSRRSRASRLDPYTGMHILFGSERQRVIEQIRTHMQPRISEPVESVNGLTFDPTAVLSDKH